jgi:hypothetical protein
MKRLVISAMPVGAFSIAVAAVIAAAPVAQAQTDVENNCRSAGGQYTSQQVQPQWGAEPVLIETCCTGGAAGQCTTYRDGVPGPTYGGG